MRERLELAHLITREALGTRHVKNKVKKFLPSYEGPFFILGQLDDLVYRIQKSPRSRVKVVHHDQLKRYLCREPLDNTWVLDQVQQWEPMEVPPPTLEEEQADSDLGVCSLFSTAISQGFSSFQPPVPVAAKPNSDVFVSSFPSHVNSENGGGAVGDSHHLGQPERQSKRQRKTPDRYGEWIA
ncbi:hypothetical protein ILYODFUR_038674 [Ilyodon furcidens]|uniref:Integrase p58-like C-terminal domain-containing protein n=1 Tax=Ilyodon furcidens TaxID=33524 RepID=A0ABV0VNL0_9TELE